MVLFAQHDVLKDSPFSRLDLVTCRNLLIYLTRERSSRCSTPSTSRCWPQACCSWARPSRWTRQAAVHGGWTRSTASTPAAHAGPRTGLPMPQAPPRWCSARCTCSRRQRAAPGVGGRAFEQPPVAGARDRAPGAATTRGGPPGATCTCNCWSAGAAVGAGRREHDIVHLSPSAGRFLQLAGGEPSRNLLRAVPPELRIDLRAALYQANADAGSRGACRASRRPAARCGRSTCA
jgi:two-component system CheB/CheR fusion protein